LCASSRRMFWLAAYSPEAIKAIAAQPANH
jgi:hypothetical protein